MTDDGRLQSRITDPRFKLEKTYWVQVESVPDEAALSAWRTGIQLSDGRTRLEGLAVGTWQPVALPAP